MLRNAFEPWHIILLVAVIVLIFGSKKLPDMARGIGKSMRVLKAETKALKNDSVNGFKEGSKNDSETPEAAKAETVAAEKAAPKAEEHPAAAQQ